MADPESLLRLCSDRFIGKLIVYSKILPVVASVRWRRRSSFLRSTWRDAADIQATTNGVLKITIPKPPKAEPKKIEVKEATRAWLPVRGVLQRSSPMDALRLFLCSEVSFGDAAVMGSPVFLQARSRGDHHEQGNRH